MWGSISLLREIEGASSHRFLSQGTLPSFSPPGTGERRVKRSESNPWKAKALETGYFFLDPRILKYLVTLQGIE